MYKLFTALIALGLTVSPAAVLAQDADVLVQKHVIASENCTDDVIAATNDMAAEGDVVVCRWDPLATHRYVFVNSKA